jgi:hypothetical protein
MFETFAYTFDEIAKIYMQGGEGGKEGAPDDCDFKGRIPGFACEKLVPGNARGADGGEEAVAVADGNTEEILNLLNLVICPVLAVLLTRWGSTSLGCYTGEYPWPVSLIRAWTLQGSHMRTVGSFEEAAEDAINALKRLSSLLGQRTYYAGACMDWVDARSFGVLSVCLWVLPRESALRAVMETLPNLVDHTVRLAQLT